MTPSLASAQEQSLQKNFIDFGNLSQNGLSIKQAVAKLRSNDVLPTGREKHVYFQTLREKEHMQFYTAFLWYNKKEAAPTLEAMQKKIEFYHNKGIDMLKLGCTKHNLANVCLHQSTY